jgi:hypothetical protein
MCSNCKQYLPCYAPRSPADVFYQLSQISGIQRIGCPYRGSWGSSMAVSDGETRGEDSSVRIQHGAFTSAVLTVADNSHVKTHKIPIPVDRVGRAWWERPSKLRGVGPETLLPGELLPYEPVLRFFKATNLQFRSDTVCMYVCESEESEMPSSQICLAGEPC